MTTRDQGKMSGWAAKYSPVQDVAFAVGAVFLLVGGGVIYLVAWLYGLMIDHGSPANFMSLNMADNWLHLGLAVGMIACGVALGGTQFASRIGRHTGTPPVTQ